MINIIVIVELYIFGESVHRNIIIRNCWFVLTVILIFVKAS